jgi:putative nucleotidyltransferase with HDIG domain
VADNKNGLKRVGASGSAENFSGGVEAFSLGRNVRPSLAEAWTPQRTDIKMMDTDKVTGLLQGDAPMGQLFGRLQPLLTAHAVPVFLVGGAVRDVLRGQESRDLDFAVADGAVALTFRVADALGLPAWVMDRERDIGRIMVPDPPTTLDFARLRGRDGEPTGDILADLAARDFTINAMALGLEQDGTVTLIDPMGGAADLAARTLRLTWPGALSADPVRALRAVRMWHKFGLHPEPQTEAAVREAVAELGTVSAERVRDELHKLLLLPVPDQGIATLHRLGLLATLLPEIAALDGVTQSAPHHEDVLGHTVSVLRWLVQVEQALRGGESADLPPELHAVRTMLAPFAATLTAHLERPVEGALDGLTLLRLGALFHDVGKRQTRSEGPDGRIHFYEHPEVGEKMVEAALRRLRLSNSAVQEVGRIVRGHMRPLLLADAGTVSRRAAWRFFDRLQTAGLDICLLTLADHLATYNGTGPLDGWERLLGVVEGLLAFHASHFVQVAQSPPLLNGNELMALLGVKPGPEIGRLLHALREEQATGTLSTPEEALAWVRAERQRAETE